VVIAASWDSFLAAVRGSGAKLPAAILLIGLGLVGGARSWAALAPAAARRSAFTAYITAQPAKYFPAGGIAQALSQVGLSAPDNSGRSSMGVSWLVHGGVQVSAAAAVGAATVWARNPSPATTFISLMSLAAAVLVLWLIHPNRASWALGKVSTLGQWTATATVPGAAQIRSAWYWTCLPLALSGVAFALLLPERLDAVTLMTVIGSYALAWAVGYLAVPLPSGAGVRELVLVALIDWLPAGAVIAVSVMHRIASIMAELAVLLVVARGLAASRQGRKA
jgi:glycosyltransferase 2 family protein